MENQQVEKMNEVDAATELGVFVGFETGPWTGELSFPETFPMNTTATWCISRGATN